MALMSETHLQCNLADWQLAFSQQVSRTLDALPDYVLMYRDSGCLAECDFKVRGAHPRDFCDGLQRKTLG
jgi:hypothetical protein